MQQSAAVSSGTARVLSFEDSRQALPSQGGSSRHSSAHDDGNMDWAAAAYTGHETDNDPTVFTVNDRKVRVEAHERDISTYELLRRWVQNDPDADNDPFPADDGPGLQLPPPLTPPPFLSRVPPPQEPPFIATENPPPIEDLLQHHLQHWKQVQRFDQEQRDVKLQRFAARLSALQPSLRGVPASPVAGNQ